MATSPQSPNVVLCTGANQGLGFEIVHVTALHNPSAVYLLSCRNVSFGHEAVQQLRQLGVKAEIEVLPLDVTDDEHIIAAVKHVETKYGKLDVLINNAGIALQAPLESSLSSVRQVYNTVLNTNLASVAVIITAFLPLLHKAPSPKVINISSGLGSITNTLTKKMFRAPPYGASKIGMNGLTVHMQTAENDRIEAEKGKDEGEKDTRIKFYVVAPGILKTAFTNYFPHGKDPKDGAEVVVRLVTDDKGTYEGGTFWEFEQGEMKIVPW